MTAHELQRWLRDRFPLETERCEFKEWRNLKSNISGRKGEDLVSYVSALANMDGGCVVIGVQDKTLSINGIQDFADYTAENVVHRILGKTPGLPSLGFRVEAIETSDTNATIWLVHVPRHAPRQPVLAHDKAWQRDGDSLTELREERRQAILTELIVGEDWSSGVVLHAAASDLDPDAIAKAREKFAAKHQTERWASEMAGWSQEQFLSKAKMTLHGKITRTALLLLGRAGSAELLSPNPAEITWKVPSERVVEHFAPPFILTTTEVGQRIRNPNIKLFPATELLAVELRRYDAQVILEGLHNCLAHQDYAQAGRVVVEELAGRLRLTNRGGFVDGRPEDYFDGSRTPEIYRNPRLAQAMNLVGMIDKGGYGIRDMVAAQRKRFLPLPDYEGSSANQTVFNIYGQTIDENYSKLLMERSDLPLEQVVWLDRVQKRQKVDPIHIAELRKAGLIEGRKPHWTVSAGVAAATNAQSEYILNRGFSDDYYKDLILRRLEKFGPTSGRELRNLIWDKLPNVLSNDAKETKVKNLRTALRLRGLGGRRIEIDPAGPARGPNAIWRVKQPDRVV